MDQEGREALVRGLGARGGARPPQRVTYRFCRWGSTARARTPGPHTPSGDTRTPRTAPPRWPRSGTARMGTPGTEAHGQLAPTAFLPTPSHVFLPQDILGRYPSVLGR